MKTLLIILFLLVGQSKGFGQIPTILHNYTSQDSTENPIIESFSEQYDFIVTYTVQSYWWPDRKSYKILAYFNDEWTSWTYSNYFVQRTKKKKNKSAAVRTVKNGEFFMRKKELQNAAVLDLISNLTNYDFWILCSDSLNLDSDTRIENGETITRKATISDGINYRFDILTKTKMRAIESYEPEYFLKKFPNMVDRRKFIKCRELFLLWWDKYCH